MFVVWWTLLLALPSNATPIDSLKLALQQDSIVQEKIYMHLDNTCYFAGDTVWYKAYVVRADDLHPTDMSRLLYVELLTPEGFVIERQHVVVNNAGEAVGQFAINDTLYSGYYELRAYTVWQLNFDNYERMYEKRNSEHFYHKGLQREFYTDYQGLYSRVIPIYEHDSREDFDKYIVPAPRRRAAKPKTGINVAFFPEGGNLVVGLKSRLAFEVTDAYGQPLKLDGKTDRGLKFTANDDGRGVVYYTPTGSSEKVRFNYKDETYSFSIPDAERTGCVLEYDFKSNKVTAHSSGVGIAAVAVNCRGKNVVFRDMQSCNNYTLNIADLHLPTGVNEVIVYDSDAKPLASRLLFVNNHDVGERLDLNLTYANGEALTDKSIAPYSKMSVSVNFPSGFVGGASLSVRDNVTDSPSYDDGNMLTDMLLAGDLKGFVAHPSYYFESNDNEHRHRLDLLLMIQGWHKYATPDTIRFEPEKTLVYYGIVHKALDDYQSLDDFDNLSIAQDVDGDFVTRNSNVTIGTATGTSDNNNQANNQTNVANNEVTETNNEPTQTASSGNSQSTGNDDGDDATLSEKDELRRDRKLGKKILVEAEIEKGNQSAGVIVPTDAYGNFKFQIPPFYDKAILFVTAYAQRDSAKKTLLGIRDKSFANSDAAPDYYIQQKLPFPVFSQPYSWYQTHEPKPEDNDSIDQFADGTQNFGLDKVNVLTEVKVKSRRRRSLRDFDLSRPVLKFDVYDLYNLVTDRGLSYGMYEFQQFPQQATTALFGNMGRVSPKRIAASVDGINFYRNYESSMGESAKSENISDWALRNKLKFKRLQSVRIYTDYNMRDGTGDDIGNRGEADVMLQFDNIPDDGTRYTYSVRRYIMDGISYPEKFYSPDYSNAVPKTPNDYRRTLYWNPNVRPNQEGKFNATFFTGSRSSKLKTSVSGLSATGEILE